MEDEGVKRKEEGVLITTGVALALIRVLRRRTSSDEQIGIQTQKDSSGLKALERIRRETRRHN